MENNDGEKFEKEIDNLNECSEQEIVNDLLVENITINKIASGESGKQNTSVENDIESEKSR
ncbi:hypothetical protein NQ314_018175 [Rhamnusium bicolor]|uniref:Uncharacterized protein n=1 Tax=Rhamnusium bicolor TaxID=1586634 RepID=A0AAV8WSJ4_9CUCU|nr:hypothetical protein NQ314_018175 [Rhamnusium bicolor]